jgi:hypothetical protein
MFDTSAPARERYWQLSCECLGVVPQANALAAPAADLVGHQYVQSLTTQGSLPEMKTEMAFDHRNTLPRRMKPS